MHHIQNNMLFTSLSTEYLLSFLIKMWIAGTADVNELKFHLPRTLCITLIRFTQNTVVDLINIKSVCETPPCACCSSPWALTT